MCVISVRWLKQEMHKHIDMTDRIVEMNRCEYYSHKPLVRVDLEDKLVLDTLENYSMLTASSGGAVYVRSKSNGPRKIKKHGGLCVRTNDPAIWQTHASLLPMVDDIYLDPEQYACWMTLPGDLAWDRIGMAGTSCVVVWPRQTEWFFPGISTYTRKDGFVIRRHTGIGYWEQPFYFEGDNVLLTDGERQAEVKALIFSTFDEACQYAEAFCELESKYRKSLAEYRKELAKQRAREEEEERRAREEELAKQRALEEERRVREKELAKQRVIKDRVRRAMSLWSDGLTKHCAEHTLKYGRALTEYCTKQSVTTFAKVDELPKQAAEDASARWSKDKKKAYLIKATGGMLCWGCGRKFDSAEYLHLDHIRPRTDGGSDNVSNLALLCPPCNGTAKKGKHLTLTGLREKNKKDKFMVCEIPIPSIPIIHE